MIWISENTDAFTRNYRVDYSEGADAISFDAPITFLWKSGICKWQCRLLQNDDSRLICGTNESGDASDFLVYARPEGGDFKSILSPFVPSRLPPNNLNQLKPK